MAVSYTHLDVYKRQDQDTAVIEKEISVTDERQNVSIPVEKQDAETGNTVAGAVFGIYNAKDIQTKDGKVIVKADTPVSYTHLAVRVCQGAEPDWNH